MAPWRHACFLCLNKKMLRQSEGGTLTGAISILLRLTFFARGQRKNPINIELEFSYSVYL